SPTPPPLDPAVTADVCALAAAATMSTTAVFEAQYDALEQAAARNDAAATPPQLAERHVTPELKTVLTGVATALTEMSSPFYTGTEVDIRKKLEDFREEFKKICTPPASASPTA